MAAVGPFEASPHVAVALSGGADSMALCLLAADWARSRGGRVTAITVDHGLRPDSAEEARTVAAWMARRAIAHRVLRWTGPKPSHGIQAAARDARYRLLETWCGEAGVLHLLLGHHRRDQAETVLMRLRRGSGVAGLAAMAAIRETATARLLRPLLAVPPGRLRAVLVARNQPWIEDPSNRDPIYQRTLVRNALPGLAVAGVTEESLAAVAVRMGRARMALEHAAAALLSRCARLHPAGYGLLDDRVLAAAPGEIGLRALARILACVGGRAYEPAAEKLERSFARLIVERSATAGTLAGCLFLRRRDGGLLVCREERGLPVPVAVEPGTVTTWDRRFAVEVAATATATPTATGKRATELRLVPLGTAGWHEVTRAPSGVRRRPMPREAGVVLPALADREGILDVAHLGYRRPGSNPGDGSFAHAVFRPPTPASGGGHFLACGG